MIVEAHSDTVYTVVEYTVETVPLPAGYVDAGGVETG